MLCDAGGGTVDLITYEIKKTEPCLQLSELVPGKGGMAGSLGLNKRFEEAVREVVGEDQFFHLKKTIGWSKALEDFDKNIKTAFNGNLRDIQYVTFPKANLHDNFIEGLTSNCWEMTGYVLNHFRPIWRQFTDFTISVVLQRIFEPIVKDILRLVEEQVQCALVKRGNQGVKVFTQDHCSSPTAS